MFDNCRISDFRGITIVEVQGDLDFRSIDTLREPLSEAVRETSSCVVLDLSACDYLDSAVAGLLLDTHRSVSGTGRFAISGVTPYMSRLLWITGLPRSVRSFSTIEDALVAMMSSSFWDGTTARRRPSIWAGERKAVVG